MAVTDPGECQGREAEPPRYGSIRPSGGLVKDVVPPLGRIDMRERIEHSYHGRKTIHLFDHRLLFVAMPEIRVDPPWTNQGNEPHMPTYETETVPHALQAAGAVHSRDN
ncbi:MULTISPECIES: hypothetical protein [unclassified Burkholderia]|uniref:hypothetical protein n=1 Tax=unclassified Burkholderia TaxID=2613784 RepID=UPI0015C664C9|nr:MULTISPECIES: hypothetical protein [unclassified Burkholderia]MCA8061267.1 hypothetical protein [Burkholderia sp. AU38729]